MFSVKNGILWFFTLLCCNSIIRTALGCIGNMQMRFLFFSLNWNCRGFICRQAGSVDRIRQREELGVTLSHIWKRGRKGLQSPVSFLHLFSPSQTDSSKQDTEIKKHWEKKNQLQTTSVLLSREPHSSTLNVFTSFKKWLGKQRSLDRAWKESSGRS